MPTITGLGEAVSANNADLLPVVQGGETKKISIDKISGLQSLGVGQTWHNVTDSRSLGVTYTNTTGKPIEVSIQSNTGGNSYITINGVLVAANSSASGGSFNIGNVTIPNGATYVFNSATTPGLWAELR